MDEPGSLVPEQIRRMLTLTLTLVAVALYGAILISALVITLYREDPQFSESMERAAGMLSGLVGAVVTAGFARSKSPDSSPISVSHPLAGQVVSNWKRLGPRSLASRNLEGLGDMLGMPDYPGSPSRAVPGMAPATPEGDEEPVVTPAPAKGMSAKMWVALTYVLIYITVGLAAFVLAIWRPEVPSIIANSAWVWFGTMISSAYTFFGLEQSG